jgi:polysaccharide export outer membrane protein
MQRRNRPRAAAILAAAAVQHAISGCTLPRPVGSFSEIAREGEPGQINLIPVTAATNPPATEPVALAFPASFSNAGEADVDTLGPGDRINIHIWESGTPTLTSSAGGGSDLGEITVDERGRVYVPYAGAVHAAGLTVPQLRRAIEDRLRTVVLNPQVDIRLIEHRSALVSVQGDAAKTGSFPIERGRTRLGQLLGEVAPSQKTPDMLEVIVRRDGQAGRVRLSDIYANPALDIPLRPGDSIILRDIVQNVTVLGAAGAQGQVPITKKDFTLVDALGAAKGLDPNIANPRAVFLLRPGADPNAVPTVYQFDMRKPQTIAYASRTRLRDGDAILISSAPFAQIRQVLIAFAQSMSAVRSAASLPL